jgi:hypothetical protein
VLAHAALAQFSVVALPSMLRYSQCILPDAVKLRGCVLAVMPYATLK